MLLNVTHYVKSSEYWSNDHVSWDEDNINIQKKLTREEHGYEVLAGTGKATGQLLGGCIDVFPMMLETEIWSKADEWKDKILFTVPVLLPLHCSAITSVPMKNGNCQMKRLRL